MATVNFNLRNPKADKPTPIHLIIRWSKKRLVIYTRERIHPKYWQTDKQKKNYQRAKKSYDDYSELNGRLNNMETDVLNVYRQYKNDNENKEPSKPELEKLVKRKLEIDKPGEDKYTLFDFIKLREKEEEARYKSLGKRVDNKCQSYSYRQTREVLENYSKHRNKGLDFDYIDLDFYYDFIDYMEEVEDFSVNNMGKHIKNLKAILNEATDRGLNNNTSFKNKKFKVLREESSQIYLSEEELQDLFKKDLSQVKHYERARDLFLVGCYTGLRFGDLTNIKPKNFKSVNHRGKQFDVLEIRMQKTGELVQIPLHPIVLKIKEKYKGITSNSLPPVISNQKMNEYLKDICKTVDSLKKKEEVIYTKGGSKVSSMVPKHKLVTTHTARRSFATNMYKQEVPTITIRKITGHKTESAFLRYIKATPSDHAAQMFEMWQKGWSHLNKVE